MNSKADFIAAMKDEKYWNVRAEMLFKNIEPDEEKLIKKLVKYYKVEAERLNKLIAEYYTKYGKDNVIEYRDLLKKLSDSERKLLIEDIDEFIKKYPHHKHLKNIRTSIYKLDRLEGLKVSAELQLLELGEKEVKDVEAFLIDVYKNGYDYARKELGFGSNFNSIDTETAKKFVNKAWVGGKSFSKRIYNNRKKVAEWIKTDFADGVKRGDSYSRLVKNLMNKFEEVSKSSAKRLVTTEASYMLNESSMKVFEDEFDEYKYNAMLDYRTSKLCRRLDGEIYKISERKAGKNFPPMHPNCRSSFTIVIPDDWMDRAVKKQKDINDFEELKKSGVDTIDNIEEFTKIKYNDNEEWDMMSNYNKIVKKGQISPLIKYSNYKKMYTIYKDKLVKLKTTDYIEIKDISYHLVARIIGTHNWANKNNSKEIMKERLNHKNVDIEDIIECIKSGKKTKESQRRNKDTNEIEISWLYVSNRCGVTVNPETGMVIQCNPLRGR